MSAALEECAGCPVLGACCYFKVELGGEHYQTSVPCPHLNLATRTCRRYQTRTKVPWCTMDVPLPAKCVHHDGRRTALVPQSNAAQRAVDALLNAKG